MSKQNLLTGHALFQSLTPAEVARISERAVLRKCVAEDVVYRPGDEARHVFLLVEGEIVLRLPTRSGFSVAIAKVESGELFGLGSLLGDGRYTVAAECLQPCKVLMIDAPPLLEVLQNNNVAGLEFTRRVARAYFARYVATMKQLQSVIDQIDLVK